MAARLQLPHRPPRPHQVGSGGGVRGVVVRVIMGVLVMMVVVMLPPPSVAKEIAR